MGGWISRDRDRQRWDGVLEADSFVGDGSGLSNLSAGTESDPIFNAASAAYNTHVASSAIHIDWTNATDNLKTSGTASAANITSGTDPGHAHTLYAASAAALTDGSVYAASGAATRTLEDIEVQYDITSAAYNTHAASNAIHFGSAAFLRDGSLYAASAAAITDGSVYAASAAATLDTQYQITSGAYATHAASTAIHFGSGAFTTHIASTAIHFGSGAFTTHIADTSDPHGANTTQTGIASTARVVITQDNDASGAAISRNILIGTEASPGAASGWTQGTVYIQYTA